MNLKLRAFATTADWRPVVAKWLCLVACGASGARLSAQQPNPARVSERRLIQARPLPLKDVRLTGGPLKHAQDLDAEYLLQLEPDRMLTYLRERAGLQPKAKPYGGWDGGGRQLTGHIAGHYLSAVSLMFAATGDSHFKARADYIVKELAEVQKAQGDGYIGALMDDKGVNGKARFEELAHGVIRSGGFDLNGLWSPWYVEHKLFAGLRDAYRYTSNPEALEVEIRFAGWADEILAKLEEEQIQKMLDTEFGGMNEVTADLYADTGDTRWLKLSNKFEHHAIVDPLAAGQDILGGKHGNTQVPKMLGSLMRYVYTGDPTDYRAANFFWQQVVLHHSFATGGHGKNEYFGRPDELSDLVDGRTDETCNVYNMLKMTREMFAISPEIRYADFHERALFNHILASQDPKDGRVCYMVPVGRGVQHEYQDKFKDFTCCVGTGMESHALHGYGIYYEASGRLWISLFVPSTVRWESAGVNLSATTDFPMGESATFAIESKEPKKFTLLVRRPYWAGSGFSIKVNGKAVPNVSGPDSYVPIERTWRTGDVVDVVLPKQLHSEALPDNPSRLSLMWGPLVLAGDLGPEQKLEFEAELPPAAPVFVTDAKDVRDWLKPVEGKPRTFRTSHVGRPADVTFVPFYELPERRYAVYWDVYTTEEWKRRSQIYAAEEDQRKKLDAATVAFVQPGQMQAERDFNEQGEDSSPVQLEGRYGRRGTKWFSFDLPVEGTSPLRLIVTYSADARRPGSFEVLVDGTRVAEQSVPRRSPEQKVEFLDLGIDVAADLVQGKKKVTVRFKAKDGTQIPGIFGVRLVRAGGQG
jgi:uncharacterized protein